MLKRALLYCLAVFCNFTLCIPTFASPGTQWLESQIQPTGEINSPSTISSPFQASVEALRAFRAVGDPVTADLSTVLPYINSSDFSYTEALARKIIVNAEAGNATGLLVSQLLTHQNADGGFGFLPGYDSTPFDTALAAEALAAANRHLSDATTAAVNYLLQSQNMDGGFSINSINESSIYATALTLNALQQYAALRNIRSTADLAADYLLQNQVAGGGWNTAAESGLALIALTAKTADLNLFSTAAQLLETSQLANGSWGDDVYTTAIVERALSHVRDLSSGPTDPALATVTGMAVNAATGLGVQGISASIQGVSTVQTSVNGNFELGNIPPGSYTLELSGAGFTGASQSITVQASQRLDVGLIPLSAIPNAGTVTGFVVDANTGAGIPGAEVELNTSTDVIRATTSSNGGFDFVTQSGAISLTASATGYEPIVLPAAVVAGQTTNVTLTLLPVGQPPIDPLISVTGVTVDSVSSAPLNGVNIRLLGSTDATTSNTTGQFQLNGIVPNEFQLEFTLPGYVTTLASITASPGSTVNLGSILLNPTGLPTTATIQGLIQDIDTGQAIAGAVVSIVGSGLSTTSDTSGSFTLTDITPGAAQLNIAAVGYAGLQSVINLQAGTITDFGVIGLRSASSTTTATIQGQVSDSDTAQPIPNAVVEIVGTGLSANTAADGSFLLENIPPGATRLTVTSAGYFQLEATTNLEAGVVTDFGVITLKTMPQAPTTTTLSGQIIDLETGQPIPGASITVNVFSHNFGGSDIADGSGQYTVADIPGQDIQLITSAPGYLSSNQSINVATPGNINLNIELSRVSSTDISISQFALDRASYTAYSRASLTVRVTNNGTAPKGIVANAIISNNQGHRIDSILLSGFEPAPQDGFILRSVVTIAPGATEDFSALWDTENNPPDDYTVLLQVSEGRTTRLLDERVLALNIQPTERLDLVRFFANPAFTNFNANEQMEFSAVLVNRSNVPFQVDLQHEWLDPSGNIIRNGVQAVALTPDTTQQLVELDNFPFIFDQSGEYNLTGSIVGGSPATIVGQSISVAPGTRIEPSQSINPAVVTPDGDKRIRIGIELQGVQQ